MRPIHPSRVSGASILITSPGKRNPLLSQAHDVQQAPEKSLWREQRSTRLAVPGASVRGARADASHRCIAASRCAARAGDARGLYAVFEFPALATNPVLMETAPYLREPHVVLPSESVITEAVKCFNDAVDEALQPSVRESYLLPESRREAVREQLRATAAALEELLRKNCVVFAQVQASFPEEEEDNEIRGTVKTLEALIIEKEKYLRRLRAERCATAEQLVRAQAERLAQQVTALQAEAVFSNAQFEDLVSDNESDTELSDGRKRALEEQVLQRVETVRKLMSELLHRLPALKDKAERLREVAQSFGGVEPSETEIFIKEDVSNLLSFDICTENLRPEQPNTEVETRSSRASKESAGAITRARLAATLRVSGSVTRIR